jgi:hypothetical protein
VKNNIYKSHFAMVGHEVNQQLKKKMYGMGGYAHINVIYIFASC